MRKIFVIAAASALSLAAFAQNGNHTVEVTNDYVSQLSGLQKTDLQMAVPDSLLHFDYKFDYSVFETPYKGAYEFSPYHIHVQPQASKYDAGKFYLRAGAGYSIRPVLDFTAAAVTKPGFTLSIYNEGGGFYGRNIGHAESAFGSGDAFTGYDFSDRFGVGARIIRPKYVLKAGVAYDLIAVGDEKSLQNTLTHSASLGLSLKPLSSGVVDYAVGASLRYTADSEKNSCDNGETLASLDGKLGFGIGQSSDLVMDFGFDVDLFRLDRDKTNFAVFNVTPSYNFSAGPFSIKAGARLDYSIEEVFSVSPAVKATARFLDDKLTFVAGADGGQTLTDRFSLKSSYHRAYAAFSAPGMGRELIHGYAGLKGHAGHIFEWGLQAGYHNWKSKACESMFGYNFANVSLLYADFNFALKTERIDFDGDVRVAKSKLLQRADIFSTPRVSGNLRLMYNQNKRFYAGVWANGQTGRQGLVNDVETSLPGWVNLGVSAEYRFSTKWGLWLEAGNLLCQEIWRTPMYAEKDPYATLGICLKF